MSEKNYSPSDFIPKPCQEDWHTMTGDKKWRHCEKCDTHVHDLTGMSSEEIISLKKSNGGKLCGAFRLGPAVGRPLALGSGIASLALAACSKEKEVVLPGIVCEPPAQEEPAQKDDKTASDEPSVSTKPDDAEIENVEPVEELDIQPIRPMILGKICPKDMPEPKRDVGPV